MDVYRYAHGQQPLPRPQVPKSLREGPPRKDSQANRRHNPLRQQNRALQIRKRCHDVCRGRRRREWDHALQCDSRSPGFITSLVQVCPPPSSLAPKYSMDWWVWNRQSVDKRTIIENYDLVSLAIDEIVDDGIILETDPTIIVQRVSKAPSQDVTQLKGIDLSEQGMNNLAQFGKAKLGDWLRQGL